MRFLITNDDGAHAPGIKLLARVVSEFGEVVTVAPATEQSGMGHRVTFDRPLRATEIEPGIHSVSGTPADCVRFAFSQLGDFDFVFSGVNDGANLGVEVFYSGTVAAAREATFFGVPAIAISQYRREYARPFDWSHNQNLVRSVVSSLLERSANQVQLINVNLPDQCADLDSNSAAAADASRHELILCDVDPSPFPPEFRLTDDGLVTTASYSNRPRIGGRDIDICFSGNIAVSYLG